jgi:hypothetical protein
MPYLRAISCQQTQEACGDPDLTPARRTYFCKAMHLTQRWGDVERQEIVRLTMLCLVLAS